jgi:hypothetical protein
VKRVLLVEPLGDAESEHPRLDAGQVPVVVGVRAVDEAHLLLEALHVVVGEQLRAVLPQPEPALPFMAPQRGVDGRYVSVSRASRSGQLTPGTTTIGWRSTLASFAFGWWWVFAGRFQRG